MGFRHRAEQPDFGPVDGQAKAHDRQPGEHADEHSQQQEESLFPGGAESEPVSTCDVWSGAVVAFLGLESWLCS